jgi:hypothetical protein
MDELLTDDDINDGAFDDDGGLSLFDGVFYCPPFPLVLDEFMSLIFVKFGSTRGLSYTLLI